MQTSEVVQEGALTVISTYRWGKIHGWITAIIGLAIFLMGPFQNGPGAQVTCYLVGPIHMLLGASILKKRRWVLWLLPSWGLLVIIGDLAMGGPIAAAVINIFWWLLPAALYYPKRIR